MIAEGLEESKQWIGASIDLQLELAPRCEQAHGPIEPIEYTPGVDYHARRLRRRCSGHAEATTAEAMAIADKTERNDRLDEIEADSARRPRRHRRDARASSPARRPR